MHVVYILTSQKLNGFYIGYTSDLEKRLQFHNNPIDAKKHTAKADDWALFFSIECESEKQGLAVEKHIKAMKSKNYIINLTKYPEISEKLLDKYR